MARGADRDTGRAPGPVHAGSPGPPRPVPTRGDPNLRPNRPSATAWRVALLRAAHQILDVPPVLADPVALAILGPDERAALEADPAAYERGRIGPYLRAFLAVRSRVAEDELALAVARGVGQYVVLGAGLDTFALRHTHPGLRVFEVDHPDTQAWKRDLIARAGLLPRGELRFAPLDLGAATLEGALAGAGFASDRPAFFSLLGVSMYLTREALRATLAFAGGRPAGSAIVFDYALPRPGDEAGGLVFDALAERVERAGEPWLTMLSPPELADEVRRAGLALAQDLGAVELNARYLAGRSDGLRVGRLARVAHARREG